MNNAVIQPFDRNYVTDEMKTMFKIVNKMNVTVRRNNIENSINTINYAANS